MWGPSDYIYSVSFYLTAIFLQLRVVRAFQNIDDDRRSITSAQSMQSMRGFSGNYAHYTNANGPHPYPTYYSKPYNSTSLHGGLGKNSNGNHKHDESFAIGSRIRVQDEQVIHEPNNQSNNKSQVNLIQHYDENTGDVRTGTTGRTPSPDKNWSKKNNQTAADL